MVENQERNTQVSGRLREYANYLIKSGKVASDKEIAAAMKTNVTTFSLVMNGRTKATDNFIMKISRLCDKINVDWIYTGNGAMLKGENPNTEQCIAEKPGENLTSALRTIELLVGQMAEKDRQIGKLIDLMAEKNTAATKDAISAAASE